ncbi:phospholipid/cholesterol/gamma-HCH transport system substrate-binding protein [Herbihabitans rhizosphaerae]|uniref:Phospholipid/cholesterol/gamma-HCH transport system substrate-binding protein n=1 Tax=Herbihabitans rhizosphaerae TaxID=1872711 RepID=A0A4V2ERG4_9PSEU|nr:MCE family protein [Herbihabitans rhizosphaerae]RZS31223.1 phospholipid/cholesterol/gamma-HCH transport system substrate-binding protein [Herbihabitans rhizosphaerae]
MRWRIACAATTLLLSGCSVSFQNMPIGRSVDGPSYELTAVFDNAAGLPLGGRVRIGPVEVGRVLATQAKDYRAHVRLRVREDVALGTATTARLRQSTALGDQYVDLLPAGPGKLAGGAVITQTSRGPDVEDSLALLGTVLSNSGFEQIRTIVTETNTMLGGREGKVRDLIERLDKLLASINARGGDLTRTLDALGALSKTAVDNKALMETALRQITPAIDVLRGQQGNIRTALGQVTSLSRTTSDVLAATQSGIIEQLTKLGPVVESVAALDGKLGSTLAGLKSFHRLLDRAVPGDYLNTDTTIDVPGSLVGLITGLPSLLPPPPGLPTVGGLLHGGTR